MSTQSKASSGGSQGSGRRHVGKEFVMKDSPPELVEAVGVKPQGRKYDRAFTEQPGAVKIEDVVIGMKYASLAITDDKPDTLKKIGKGNPWHIEALRIITGSKEEAHKPLSHILPTHMGLQCDEIIDVSGVAKNGQVLDTQGYIAHNESTIVLAYRCTTSAKDWLTNFSTTSSAWEPDEDAEQGHSGYCSGFEGLCCNYDGEYRPRVHTGFYNNFLATLPAIKEKILPLLEPTEGQPPRTLYVVGHSLGAGIATMAACYFLLHVDWETLPHRFLAITAGSPRAVQKSMRDYVRERMNVLRPLDKAVVCRVVRDRDVVPTLPPEFLGFRHLDKLVYITDSGEILINPKLKDDHIIDEREMKELVEENPDIADELSSSSSSSSSDGGGDGDGNEAEKYGSKKKRKKSKYEKMVSKIPRPFRDHMPDFYLVPLLKLFENETGIPQNFERDDEEAEEEDEQYDADNEEAEGERNGGGEDDPAAEDGGGSNRQTPVQQEATSDGKGGDAAYSDSETSSSSSRESSEESPTKSNKASSSSSLKKTTSTTSSDGKKSPSSSSNRKSKLVKMFSRKKKKKKNSN